MLFYHIKLRCYVVVELKAVSFEPEFAGKLNFYVNAVNELMKSESDNPTIGLLICKDKDQTEVQWAFQGIETPMGVATYDNIRLQEIKSQLPSEEAIQKRLEQAEEYILKADQFKEWSESDVEICRKIVTTLPLELADIMNTIKNERNDINHFGIRPDPMNCKALGESLKEHYTTVKQIVERMEGEKRES